MSLEWKRLCEGYDLEVVGDCIDVRFQHGRRQRVRIEEVDGSILAQAVIARQAIMRELDAPALFAWKRNRLSRVVGLRVDERGRLIGQAWLPVAGLNAHEFQLGVRAVAAECDRVEHLLTGRDVE